MNSVESLLSISKFYGSDITPEQQDYINSELEELNQKDQAKFLDLDN